MFSPYGKHKSLISITLAYPFEAEAWFEALGVYLLLLCRKGNAEDEKGLMKVLATCSYLKNDPSDEADFCRGVLELGFQFNSSGGMPYSCADIFVKYVANGRKGDLDYETAVKMLEWGIEHPKLGRFGVCENQLILLKQLKEFREAIIPFLKDKQKPETETLTPEELIEIVNMYFSNEAVFAAIL